MKIVAFLQNQWFNNPARVKATIDAQPEDKRDAFRQRFATHALFAGCLTGRRLRDALGELCEEIYWENASLEMGEVSSSSFKADHEHIRRVLEQQQPTVVIAFGRSAGDALAELVPEGQLLYAPHPAARGALGVAALKDLKTKLERLKANSKFA